MPTVTNSLIVIGKKRPPIKAFKALKRFVSIGGVSSRPADNNYTANQ